MTENKFYALVIILAILTLCSGIYLIACCEISEYNYKKVEMLSEIPELRPQIRKHLEDGKISSWEYNSLMVDARSVTVKRIKDEVSGRVRK